MILAVGNSGALEFEAFSSVREHLAEHGQGVVLFKQDRCLNGEYLSYETGDEKGAYTLTIDGLDWSLDQFSAVWYMHPFIDKSLLRFEPAKYRQFISSQFLGMRRAIWHLKKRARWINDPWKSAEAENKIYQLETARECGMEVPPTLVTSDPDRVRRFFHRHGGKIIAKGLEPSPLVDEVLFTRQLTEGDMGEIDRIRYAPGIFQRRIAKAYELRVTVVGEHIFPVKIYSQEDEATSVDWRVKPKLNDFDVRMERTTIPRTVEEQILLLMKRLGLLYGAIDAIVTPEGKYVFLEINPNGQWYFVQLRSHVEIAPAIASLLV